MVKAMPDQGSAANEHAILQEITAPLTTLPDDAMPLVADPNFPVALRGYDRLAVDAYVNKTSQLVAELQATRSPDAAIRRALERVGEEVSGILKRAHETAEQITSQSRREAEDRLEVARQEAAQMLVDAEQRLKDLDSETDRIWGERHRIIGDTRGLAQELLALADSAGQRFPEAEETAALEPESELVDDEALALEEPTEQVSEDDAGSDVTAVLPPLPPETDQHDR
jgi:cell division septum initiation protein DivIVA